MRRRVLRGVLRTLALFAATLLTTVGAAVAEPAGEVLFVQGVGTIQTAGQSPAIIGKGVQINQGDIITTADSSYVLIKYADGTRMTIRPDSQLVVHTYEFKADASAPRSGSMLFDLLKGGLRTVTGLISKRDSRAALIHTPTSTIGIRGTDLELRLCNGDCAREQQAAAGKRTPRLNNILASARVVQLQGSVAVVAITGERHALLQGSPLYPGDTIETGAASFAVLGFRDESRVTIQAQSRSRLEDFVFDERNPGDGRFLLDLISGGLRAFTGLIGRANHDHVGIHTPAATIGIRGTGIDLFEEDSGVFYGSTWQGTMAVTQTPSGESLDVHVGETASFSTTEHLHYVQRNPHIDGPRPDTVEVDWHQLFGHDAFDGTESGLWMYVRKGPVHVDSNDGRTLDAGDHEVLYFDDAGPAYGRPFLIPLFFDSDETPDPTQVFHFDLLNQIKASGIDAVCRR